MIPFMPITETADFHKFLLKGIFTNTTVRHEHEQLIIAWCNSDYKVLRSLPTKLIPLLAGHYRFVLACRCPDGTQFLFCQSKLAASKGWFLPPDGSIVDRAVSTEELFHEEQFTVDNCLPIPPNPNPGLAAVSADGFIQLFITSHQPLQQWSDFLSILQQFAVDGNLV